MKLYIDEVTGKDILLVLLYIPRFILETLQEFRLNLKFYPYEISTPLDFDTRHKEKCLRESKRRKKRHDIRRGK